jgi:hypothetical protein
MGFSKTFPRNVPGSNYPVWEEISLSSDEEKAVEEACKRENFRVLDQCLGEGKALAIKHGMNTEEIVTRIAVALFEKRVSHEVFWKENKAKEKFDKKQYIDLKKL